MITPNLEQLDALKERVRERADQYLRAIDLVKELVVAEEPPPPPHPGGDGDAPASRVPAPAKAEHRLAASRKPNRNRAPLVPPAPKERRMAGSTRDLARVVMARMGQFTTKQLGAAFAKAHPKIKLAPAFLSCAIVQLRERGEVDLARPRVGRGNHEAEAAIYRWIGEKHPQPWPRRPGMDFARKRNPESESGGHKAKAARTGPKPNRVEQQYAALRETIKTPAASPDPSSEGGA